jgi:hypothetical protein
MDFLLLLLRYLLGLPTDETAGLQPLRARSDGRICRNPKSFVPAVWIPGIGWLTLPERFTREQDTVSSPRSQTCSSHPLGDDEGATGNRERSSDHV